jgi:aryl-alcohol dehydrogenase-like predicted oxidoreductase
MRFVEVDGARVSVIGLGCWQFGSSDWGYGDDYARREAGAIVERALDFGVNLVDTAEIYAYGRSERIVGERSGPARRGVPRHEGVSGAAGGAGRRAAGPR